MNRGIDFTLLGGLYTYQDTLEYMQNAYSQSIDAIAKSFGDKVIMTGLVRTGSTVTDGWVILNGELLPVVGGTVQSYLYLETLLTKEQFADGVQRDVYTTKRLKFTSVAGGNYLFTDFARLPFTTTGLKDGLLVVQTLFNKLLFDEPVILSGCETSGLNVPDSKITISPGTVWMDGKLLSAPSYTNSVYPAYLKPDATYTTVMPVSGSYIAFDYETSQRYAHVIRRNTASTGETVMHTNSSELTFFDVTSGLGKWKWKGWKICDLLKSRSPLGYDNRTSQPAGVDNEAWDAAYNTIGTRGGKKKHGLIEDENGPHKHGTGTGFPQKGGIGGGPGGLTAADGPNGTYTPTEFTAESGAGTPHETRHPFGVVLIIEKI